jgi:hypothetical protein
MHGIVDSSCQFIKTYLTESLVATVVALCEQSLPPKLLLQTQVAVHVVSNMEHDARALSEGSEYRHIPFAEHTVPEN